MKKRAPALSRAAIADRGFQGLPGAWIAEVWAPRLASGLDQAVQRLII
jgi:hypothetical protein